MNVPPHLAQLLLLNKLIQKYFLIFHSQNILYEDENCEFWYNLALVVFCLTFHSFALKGSERVIDYLVSPESNEQSD